MVKKEPLEPASIDKPYNLFEAKWHPSIMADVEHYIERGEDLTMSALARYLNTSRTSLYNWMAKHDGFRLKIMDMRCKGMFKMPMWGDEKRNAKHFKEL